MQPLGSNPFNVRENSIYSDPASSGSNTMFSGEFRKQSSNESIVLKSEKELIEKI